MKSKGKIHIQKMNLDELHLKKDNPRKIAKDALNGLTASVRRFGCVQPIIWNEGTGNVVGGHQRLRVLIALGETEAEVVVVRLSPTDEQALCVSLNNTNIQGEFTQDLQPILDKLKTEIDDVFNELCLDRLDETPEDDERYLEDFDFVEKPRPSWLLLTGPEDLVAKAEAELKKYEGSDVRIEVSHGNR